LVNKLIIKKKKKKKVTSVINVKIINICILIIFIYILFLSFIIIIIIIIIIIYSTGLLSRGECVTTSDGTVVRPEQVKEPDKISSIFIVVDCPSLDHIPSLIQQDCFRDPKVHPYTRNIIHILGDPLILKDPSYQSWMKQFPENCNVSFFFFFFFLFFFFFFFFFWFIIIIIIIINKRNHKKIFLIHLLIFIYIIIIIIIIII